MKQCTLYVVRHGESTYNKDDLLSGHGNPALTKTGKKQAEVLARKLSNIHFDEVYTSDLQRAITTAEIISGKAVPKKHRLYQLRERHFGELEGKPAAHWRNLNRSEQYQALTDEARWAHKHLPDIESDHEIAQRYAEAIQELAGQNPGKTVLIVAHGGALRTLLIRLGYATLANLPPGSVQNTGYVKLTYAGRQLKVKEVEGVIPPGSGRP